MKNIFDLKAMQKKGSLNMKGTMTILIGALIAVLLVVEFAPQIFGGLSNLSAVAGVPSWVTIVAPILGGLLVLGVIAKSAGVKIF